MTVFWSHMSAVGHVHPEHIHPSGHALCTSYTHTRINKMNIFLKKWETILPSVLHPSQARGSPIVSAMSSVFRSNLGLFPLPKLFILEPTCANQIIFLVYFCEKELTMCSPKSQPLRLEMGMQVISSWVWRTSERGVMFPCVFRLLALPFSLPVLSCSPLGAPSPSLISTLQKISQCIDLRFPSQGCQKYISNV